MTIISPGIEISFIHGVEFVHKLDIDPVTVCACVAWLSMHHGDWKPEFLAGQMAREFLPAAGHVTSALLEGDRE